MNSMSVLESFVFMLPVVFTTALVSSCMRHRELGASLLEAGRLTVFIILGITGLSAVAFAIHYLFGGGVIWH